MAVKDYMTKKVIFISPDTTVAHAADLMREQGLRRLPVIENDRLVGLVTEGVMAEATPSKATSLSIYEMNYLLNKTKIRDIMIKDVYSISRYASLEDAIYTMMKNKVGVLPVVDNNQVYGIITDKDIFKAFLEVSGYGEAGTRVIFLGEDSAGTLAKIVDAIADASVNIKRTVVANHQTDKTTIEIQLDGILTDEAIKAIFKDVAVTIEAIEHTEAKML
ncbi:CBS domain-containing protein [Streptococcus sp. zg-JUN1979]|uniref:CBS domain-containing protein n=1 Tax=Streptococcus sp. zg-JUN1979 TaxID=3391450 RepID=UPI0039A77690